MAIENRITPKAGVTGSEIVLSITDADATTYILNTPMVVGGMLDIGIENQGEVSSYGTLDSATKHKTVGPGEAKITGNLVAELSTFMGDGATDGVESVGIFGLQKDKTVVDFTVFMGKNQDGTGGTTVSGTGTISGYSLSNAGDGKWESPFTIEVDGDFTNTLS